jgi:integrase/recombinase XerD
MAASFSQFIRERQYLQNVSPATIEWYKHSFKWLPNESPSQEELREAVVRMREKGLEATGCNSAIRAINAYLKWSDSAHRVLYLKEEQRVLPTFSLTDVKKLISHRPKPKNFYQRRLHLLILVLLDTGCRIDEVLSLTAADCDLDNLLFTVSGKGRKQRKIPFSFELRRHLSRFLVDLHQEQFIFATRHGRKLGRRNVLRDVKRLCQRLGVTPPERTLHAFRHTFAIHYLRKGGSVFHLQKVLGHSTLEMTRRYANLLTEDLQAVHQKISLLAA